MRDKAEYRIIESNYPGSLADFITDLMRGGWTPLGGPFQPYVPGPWYQAVIRDLQS